MGKYFPRMWSIKIKKKGNGFLHVKKTQNKKTVPWFFFERIKKSERCYYIRVPKTAQTHFFPWECLGIWFQPTEIEFEFFFHQRNKINPIAFELKFFFLESKRSPKQPFFDSIWNKDFLSCRNPKNPTHDFWGPPRKSFRYGIFFQLPNG